LTPDELRVLLPDAQAGNQAAIDRICEAYSRLIFKLSHRDITCCVLGEDAENTAWMWFLELVHSYHGDKFEKFPGLARRYLIYKFVRLMKREGTQWDKETKRDASCVNNPFDGAEDDNLTNVLNSLALRQEFGKLTKKQQEILNLYFGSQKSQREIATLYGYSTRGVGYQKDLAIKLIRDKFYK